MRPGKLTNKPETKSSKDFHVEFSNAKIEKFELNLKGPQTSRRHPAATPAAAAAAFSVFLLLSLAFFRVFFSTVSGGSFCFGCAGLATVKRCESRPFASSRLFFFPPTSVLFPFVSPSFL